MAPRHAPLLILLAALAGVAPATHAQGVDPLTGVRQVMAQEDWPRAIRLLSDHLKAFPDDLEARYLRGVAYGERGKHPTLANRVAGFLRKGAEDFGFILERDSLYQDTWFQYAKIKRYDGNYPEALALGHRQIALKPDLPRAQAGLFHLYWRYIVETPPAKARRWLREQDTEHAQFFTGEVLRRQDRYQRADDQFVALLGGAEELSRAVLLLARARVYYAWGRPEKADVLLEAGINAIRTPTDALLFFDDIKHIVTPAELSVFETLRTPEDFRGYFKAFWVSRDPMPASPYNARIAEHYQRLRLAEQQYLLYGYRAWFNNPGTIRAGDLPMTYGLAGDFDDRGVIFIRQGAPDDWEMSNETDLMASWLYLEEGMVLHFQESSGPGTGVGRMRFVPGTTQDLSVWGGRRVGTDRLEMENRSYASIYRGVTTDRHTWNDGVEEFTFPYQVAAFRGEGRHTLLELHFALPTEPFEDALAAEAVPEIEVGLAVHDAFWQVISERRERHSLMPDGYGGAWSVGALQVDVRPDTYHVALHGRAPRERLMGTARFGYRAPDFSGPGLQVSDVLLAHAVHLTDAPGRFKRGDILLDVNPSVTFASDAALYVYYEIYNLAQDPTGQHAYQVSYTLAPDANARRGVWRRGQERTQTLMAQEVEGSGEMAREYAEIDVTNIDPGHYLLTVTVVDTNTRQERQVTRTLELTR